MQRPRRSFEDTDSKDFRGPRASSNLHRFAMVIHTETKTRLITSVGRENKFLSVFPKVRDAERPGPSRGPAAGPAAPPAALGGLLRVLL